MSVGNVTQAVNLERDNLTLVLGNNVDLGGDGSLTVLVRLLLSMLFHMVFMEMLLQTSEKII